MSYLNPSQSSSGFYMSYRKSDSAIVVQDSSSSSCSSSQLFPLLSSMPLILPVLDYQEATWLFVLSDAEAVRNRLPMVSERGVSCIWSVLVHLVLKTNFSFLIFFYMVSSCVLKFSIYQHFSNPFRHTNVARVAVLISEEACTGWLEPQSCGVEILCGHQLTESRLIKLQ